MMATRLLLSLMTGSALAFVFAQGCGGNEAGSGFGLEEPGVTGGGNVDPTGDDGGGGGVDPGTGGFGSGDSGAQPPGGNPTDKCATASADTKALPVYMNFIIDGSGSMDGASGNWLNPWVPGARETDPMDSGRETGKKWIAMRGAMDAFFDDLGAKNDPQFAVGMYLFSSTSTKSATKVDVPIAFVDAAQAAKLRARLDPPIFGKGGTPLAASIEGQVPILQAYTPAAPVEAGGKFVMVLVTDGVPSDSANDALDAVKAAATGTPPITTFAVGVGDPTDSKDVYDELYMAKLAAAGGTAAPGCNPNWSDKDTSGTPCHFQITPGKKSAADIQKDFVAAISQIRDTVASCEFPLVKPDGAGAMDPSKVNVVFSSNGTDTTIPQSDANGWTYDDPNNPSKVVLNGDACAKVKADPSGKVRIVVGCQTVKGPN